MVDEASQQLPQDQPARKLAGTSDSIMQFLTFELNREIYGIDILSIREIINLEKITRVPMMPNIIAGVINLRGSVVPVVDLALRFSQQPSIRTKRSSIVILNVDYEGQCLQIGVTVDVVLEVLDILSEDIEATPSFGTKIRQDFIDSMGKVNGKLLVLLAIEQITSVAELSALDMI